MPWHASLLPDHPIVETRYSGELSATELGAAAGATLELAKTHGTNLFLADCTALVGGHSVFDLYFLADTIRANGFTKMLREAVLLPTLPAPTHNVEFWKTTAINRGFDVRLFSDRADALGWLLA